MSLYFALFITFLKIGTFTIGGGYAMIALVQREVVNKGWLTDEEFLDLFTITQSLPGIIAVNIAIFIGYRLRKFKGALVCMLGTVLPSFVIILSIALFFSQIQDNVWVERVFKGLRPAVVALIAVPVFTAIKSLHLSKWMLLIPITSALAIWLLNISPIYIIIVSAIGGVVYSYYKIWRVQ